MSRRILIATSTALAMSLGSALMGYYIPRLGPESRKPSTSEQKNGCKHSKKSTDYGLARWKQIDDGTGSSTGTRRLRGEAERVMAE